MNLLNRPKVVYPVLVVLIVGLFALSAVGNTNDTHKSSGGPSYWIGAIGWFGFLIAVLATILYTVALAAHVLRRRRTAGSQQQHVA